MLSSDVEREPVRWMLSEISRRLAELPGHPAPAPVFHANALIEAAQVATRRTQPLLGGLRDILEPAPAL